MSKALEQEVRRRAEFRCEYCRLPQSFTRLQFVMDHIIAQQHGGGTDLKNLALCCQHCNSKRGPNLAGWDQVSQKVVRLFHPREDLWAEHFRWHGAVLVGLTEVGRVTVAVLGINAPSRVGARRALMDEGVF